MLQGTPGRRVSEFYDHHPISEAGVLAALARRGRGLPEGPTVDDLFEFDQDHYGGLAAVDALASRAGVGAQSRVLDVCAGLGGPARFLSRRRGSKVVALELHAGRALGPLASIGSSERRGSRSSGATRRGSPSASAPSTSA